LHIDTALAVTASGVGERRAAQYGLGFLLARASGTFDTTGIFMELIILALLAIGTYNLMARLEKRLLHWQGETASILGPRRPRRAKINCRGSRRALRAGPAARGERR